MSKATTRRKPIFGWGINDADYLVSYRPNPEIRNVQEMCLYYKRWYNMLDRGINKKDSTPEYSETTVSDDWKYFMAFRGWSLDNGLNESNRSLIELDKDILFIHNNHYSPDTCCFVTRQANALFVTSNGSRGKTLLGTSLENHTQRYIAKMRYKGKTKNIGTFINEMDAHNAWKIAKADAICDYLSYFEDDFKLAGLTPRQVVYDAIASRVKILHDSANQSTIINNL